MDISGLRIGPKLITASALDSMLYFPQVKITIPLLKFMVVIWHIASILVSICIVNLRLAGLVLGLVNIYRFESCFYNLGI